MPFKDLWRHLLFFSNESFNKSSTDFSVKVTINFGIEFNNFSGFNKDVRPKGKYPPNCTIWDRWVFNNFILADEPFAKDLWNLETCVSDNNNFGGKLSHH